ncbi:hypothetical protein [Devosia sp.]|uniref:hypothetical protein n=1 Tax=Devosia sp. TaxID=1871048 RepID=UPI002AFE16F7|nr:hypothetical protein [Devosia sp.]
MGDDFGLPQLSILLQAIVVCAFLLPMLHAARIFSIRQVIASLNYGSKIWRSTK